MHKCIGFTICGMTFYASVRDFIRDWDTKSCVGYPLHRAPLKWGNTLWVVASWKRVRHWNSTISETIIWRSQRIIVQSSMISMVFQSKYSYCVIWLPHPSLNKYHFAQIPGCMCVPMICMNVHGEDLSTSVDTSQIWIFPSVLVAIIRRYEVTNVSACEREGQQQAIACTSIYNCLIHLLNKQTNKKESKQFCARNKPG